MHVSVGGVVSLTGWPVSPWVGLQGRDLQPRGVLKRTWELAGRSQSPLTGSGCQAETDKIDESPTLDRRKIGFHRESGIRKILPRVLLVNHDKERRGLPRDYFELEDFSAACAHDGQLR